MKVSDLVHISIHSPLYAYVGGMGIIVSTTDTGYIAALQNIRVTCVRIISLKTNLTL